MIIWELIFSFVIIFNIFTVPLKLAFPEVSRKFSAEYLWLELILETMWVLQIIQTCITADPPRTTTLEAIIKKYAKSGMLFLDVITTVSSIILLIMRLESVGVYFMLSRYAHAP